MQITTHCQIASLLLEHGILKDCSPQEAFDRGITQAFYPHGLGHMLGIQTHDVGGDQVNEAGDKCEQDPRIPHARMTRKVRENEVITVEPGLYFIPTLLNAKKNSSENRCFNWKFIDELVPLGGIRIEDNIVVKESQSLNLTRKYLP